MYFKSRDEILPPFPRLTYHDIPRDELPTQPGEKHESFLPERGEKYREGLGKVIGVEIPPIVRFDYRRELKGRRDAARRESRERSVQPDQLEV